jgi:subtilase family serine protease
MQNRFFSACSLAAGLSLVASGLSGAPGQPNRQTQVRPPSSVMLVRPDLVIRSVAITPGEPTVMTARDIPVTQLKRGQKYSLICRYANTGGALKGVWKLGYYIDGQMVSNQYWGDVPAGAEQTKRHEGYVPATVGQHTYECRLDYDKEVAEKDENNNQTQMSFAVIP